MEIVIESWITSEHLGDDKLTKKLPQMTELGVYVMHLHTVVDASQFEVQVVLRFVHVPPTTLSKTKNIAFVSLVATLDLNQ